MTSLCDERQILGHLRKSKSPFSYFQNRNEIYRDLGVTYIEIAGETVEMEVPINKDKKSLRGKGEDVHGDATVCQACYLLCHIEISQKTYEVFIIFPILQNR